MSTALSDINKAWQSVAELKKELERTEKKLQKAAKISFRSTSSTSILRETNPLLQSYVKPDLIIRDGTNWTNRTLHTRPQVINRNHDKTGIKYTRKISRKNFSNAVESKSESSAKLPLKDLSWKQNQIAGTDHYKHEETLFEENHEHSLAKNAFQEKDDAYNRAMLHQAVAETAIRYVNDYIPSAVSAKKENNHSCRIQGVFKKPSLKGLQQIRDVVERQKQQMQIASFKNEDKTEENVDAPNLKDNLTTSLEDKSEETNNSLNHDNTSKAESSALPGGIVDNIPIMRKTVTAALPPQYRGFTHSGDKHVRWKVGESELKPKVQQKHHKMKRVKKFVDTSNKKDFIVPSCWKDAQELIKRTLGSPTVLSSHHNHESSTKADSGDKVSEIFNDKTGASISSNISEEAEMAVTNMNTECETEKRDDIKHKKISKVSVECEQLSSEAKKDDKIVTMNKSSDTVQKTDKSPKRLPMKRTYSKKRKASKPEAEKNMPAPKIRHYDPHVVRNYIDKKKMQRRQNQLEEQKRKKLAEEFKKQRLEQLYAFQKQAAKTNHLSRKCSETAKYGTTRSESIRKNSLPNLCNKAVQSNLPSAELSLNTQPDDTEENSIEMSDLAHSKDGMKYISEETTSVSFINDMIDDVSSKNNEEPPAIVGSASEVHSDENIVPVLDERVIMLKQLATSLQDQIALETQRIHMLMQKPPCKRIPTHLEQLDNSRVIHHPTPSQILTHERVSSDEPLNFFKNENDLQNDECLPGVSNVHLHVLEVNKLKVRTQAAIKIQALYRGFKARKMYKEMLHLKEKNFVLERLEGSLSEGPLESDDDLIAAGEGSQIIKLKHLASNEEISVQPGQSGDDQRSFHLPEENITSIIKKTGSTGSTSIDKDAKINLSPSSVTDKVISIDQHISQNVDLPDYSSDFAVSDDEAASIISGQNVPSESTISEASIKSASNICTDASTSMHSSHSSNLSKQKHNVSVSSIASESHTSQSYNSDENNLIKQVQTEELHSETIQEAVSGDIGTLSEGTLSTLSENQISPIHLSETVKSDISNKREITAKAVNLYSTESDENRKKQFESLPSMSSLSTSKLKDISEAVVASAHSISDDDSSKVESLHTSHRSSKISETVRTPSTISTASSISHHSLVHSDSDSSTIKESTVENPLSFDSQKASGSERDPDHISKRNSSSQDGTSDDQVTVLSSSHHRTSAVNDDNLPSLLGMCMSAELSRLDTVNNSLLYLSEFGHLSTVINHERDTLALAHMLQAQDGRRQEQQENMMHQILQHQESQARLMEETRNEQKKLLQDIIAEAHAAIAEKTLKVVEVQAEAVKSSADALLGLAESHQKTLREPTPNYSSDFEDISGNKRSQDSASRDNSLLKEHAVTAHSDSVPEEVENASFQSSTAITESKQSKNSHHTLDSGSMKLSEVVVSVIQTKGSRESTDESLPESLHSDYISEVHQNSNQKSVSEISSVAESPPIGDGLIDKSVQVSSVPGRRHNIHNLSRHRPHTVVSDQDSLSSLDQLSLSTEEHNSEGLQSLISDDSFTKFTIDMFHRLAHEEQLRARHQLARLQLQEKELMSKARAELACLELLKKKLKKNGSHEKVSSVRKKQRALLLQLHQERAQLRWLQETYHSSIRKNKFAERKIHDMKDFQLPTSSSHPQYLKSQKSEDTKSSKSSSAQPSSSSDIVSSENDIAAAADSDVHSDIPVPSEASSVVTDSQSKTAEEVLSKISTKHSQDKIEGTPKSRHDSNYTFESLLQGLKRLETSKRYLTKREQKLLQRRKDVENLLEWQQKLNIEEAELRGIEHKLLIMEKDRKQRSNSVTSLKSNVIKTSVENERTSNIEYGYSSTSVPQTDVEVSPGSSAESQGISQKGRSESGSSIPEEALSLKNEGKDATGSIPEEISSPPKKSSSPEEILSLKNGEQDDSGSIPEVSTEPRKRSSETDIYSESFEPSDHANTSVQQSSESAEKKFSGTNKKGQNITIRFPLVPRTHRRHDSSGSEDSFTISQSETASDQSDIEGRIQALNDELKKRQAEAEKLKKENKRKYREQLKERESSLKKQIEVYDQYIQKAKRELEQHLENGSSLYSSPDSTPVKPQIKQPCLAESRRLRRNFTTSGDLSPPSEALKVSLSHKTSETGSITSPETDNDKEQSLSQASTFTSSVEGKSSLSQNTDESGTSKLHVGGGDAVVSTSASIVTTQITPSGDKSSGSGRETKSNLQTDAQSEISDKSGATLSEAKQTVIEDVIQCIQENDDTEIEVEISEDSIPSEDILKSLPKVYSDEKPDTEIQQESDTELNEESHSKTIHSSKKENEVSVERKEAVDKLTDNIFDLLCKDAFATLKSAPTKQQQTITENSQKEAKVIPEVEIVDIKNKENQEITSETFSEKLVGILIKDSIDCVLGIVDKQNSAHHTIRSIERNDEKHISDTTKKVNSILATLNDKKLAKEKLRPQDLMVLSPMLDTTEDNNWEITTDLDVDTADINGICTDSSVIQKQDFLYESEWFDDDDFGLGRKDNQQSTRDEFLNQYYREIPNKPPPPYTPPLPKFEEKKSELFSVVAHTPEEIQAVVTEAVAKLFEGIQQNIPLSDIQLPSEYAEEEQDVTVKSQKCYKHFLFDLTKEIACEMYSETKEEPPPWIKAWKLNRKSLLPTDCNKFTDTITQKTLELLGMQDLTTSVGHKKQASLLKLGRKKRDFVDNILIQELREEEYSWVNYEQDEIFIKTEIADYIFDTLIEDTIRTIQEFQFKGMLLNK